MGRGSTRVVIGGGEVNGFQKHIYIIFVRTCNNVLFSHQMLLIYQRMFPSLKSSLLQKHMLQLLDSQDSNVQLMKSLTLRMQPDQVKNLPQFVILLAFQGSLLTKVWNNIVEVPNFSTCVNKLLRIVCCLSAIHHFHIHCRLY